MDVCKNFKIVVFKFQLSAGVWHGTVELVTTRVNRRCDDTSNVDIATWHGDKGE